MERLRGRKKLLKLHHSILHHSHRGQVLVVVGVVRGGEDGGDQRGRVAPEVVLVSFKDTLMSPEDSFKPVVGQEGQSDVSSVDISDASDFIRAPPSRHSSIGSFGRVRPQQIAEGALKGHFDFAFDPVQIG